MWALFEQLPIVQVSTDSWIWCDRLYNSNFSCISKKSLRSSVEMTLFTLVFHMQLRSWKLKLQPKIMSYLDKRHVAGYHALIKHDYFLSVSQSFSLTHSHTSTQPLITPLMGICFRFFSSFWVTIVQSTYVGFIISICKFRNCMDLRYHWKSWSDVINMDTYLLKKTIQTTPTKTFRIRCMKLPFPSVLHSSPLWFLACSTGLFWGW